MKRTIRKTFALYVVLVFSMAAPSTFAQSDSNGVVSNLGPTLHVEDLSKIVHFVDNTKGTVVIDDFAYILQLNTKIYDERKRLVNRYALKEGQRVLLEISGESSGRYLESIFIQSK